ncbi:MAG: hypothetical protein QXL22_02605 [Candidatus Nezhaarchaeales archaeon]|uniref:Type III-B CRISPR module-associated protein Cmr3 n=1 Tax=Ignisphaera aggregans TaxID=334771 RepID=A0A7J3MZJ3_9CREN
MKILEIKPLEPLSLSLSPIGGIDIFTVTHSTPIPLPTTVAGALGASMNVKPLSSDPIDSLIELIRELGKICGAVEDPIVLGPLTCLEKQITDASKCYTYIYPKGLVSLSLCSIDIRGKIVYLNLDKCKGDEERYIDFTPLTMVGVSLQRTGPGEDKTVRYGYMYRYPLTIYRTSSGKVVNPVYIYRFNCGKDVNTITRFGGESRVAKLVTRDVEADYLKNIRTPLKKLEKGLYISLSPIPMIPLKSNVTRLNPETVELPIPMNSVIGIPQKDSPPKIKIDRLGLGFSEVVERRRPEILALPPGTAIMIEEDRASTTFSDLMKGLLSIGFASLYKLG